MDGTGVGNVQKPGKVVDTRGARQVERITNAERSATVTGIGTQPGAVGYCSPTG